VPPVHRALLLGCLSLALLSLNGCSGGGASPVGSTSAATPPVATQQAAASGTASVAPPPGSAPAASQAAGSLPDACSLLTSAEVQAWVDGTVGSPQGTATDCTFKNEAGKGVEVHVIRSVSGAQFASEMSDHSGVAFSGAGDAAYLAKANALAAFLKGSVEVMLNFSSSLIDPSDADNLESLAKDAAAKL
jgi:hypothetical protein